MLLKLSVLREAVLAWFPKLKCHVFLWLCHSRKQSVYSYRLSVPKMTCSLRMTLNSFEKYLLRYFKWICFV